MAKIVGVKFKNTAKIYYFAPEEGVEYQEKSGVIVETAKGLEYGTVVLGVTDMPDEKIVHPLKPIIRKATEKDEKTVLVLVGVGELMDDVKAKIHELGLDGAVILTGVRNDVPKLLSAFDAFVFPSFYEGMPNTVIEAQATGLPCVIADTITREANITGLVEYLPLGDAELWARKSLLALEGERLDTRDDFVKNKYDVESAALDFAKTVMPD